ncbi:hypothetical protein D3C72_991990 [compost metagenome]
MSLEDQGRDHDLGVTSRLPNIRVEIHPPLVGEQLIRQGSHLHGERFLDEQLRCGLLGARFAVNGGLQHGGPPFLMSTHRHAHLPTLLRYTRQAVVRSLTPAMWPCLQPTKPIHGIL